MFSSLAVTGELEQLGAELVEDDFVLLPRVVGGGRGVVLLLRGGTRGGRAEGGISSVGVVESGDD